MKSYALHLFDVLRKIYQKKKNPPVMRSTTMKRTMENAAIQGVICSAY